VAAAVAALAATPLVAGLAATAHRARRARAVVSAPKAALAQGRDQTLGRRAA
jgi:hypothetical protein